MAPAGHRCRAITLGPGVEGPDTLASGDFRFMAVVAGTAT